MSNEGSLFVVVIAPIEGVEEKSATGLKVALGEDGPVPIGHLTKNFITSKCATFAEKPKVFIFIDPEIGKNDWNGGSPEHIKVCLKLSISKLFNSHCHCGI
jgi:hypothetical protein